MYSWEDNSTFWGTVFKNKCIHWKTIIQLTPFSWESIGDASVFPDGASGKELTCQCRSPKSRRFNPWWETLEEEMATHSSILAWRIPWTEEPGGLQSMGSQRVGHDWSGLAHTDTQEMHLGLACLAESYLWPLWSITVVTCLYSYCGLPNTDKLINYTLH